MRKWLFVLLAAGLVLMSAGLVRAQEPGPVDTAKRVKSLIKKLASDDDVVRFRAVKALKKLGTKAKAAVPALKALAEGDADEDVREAARQTLKGLAAGGTSIVGTWEGAIDLFNRVGITQTVRLELRADGTFQSILKTGSGGLANVMVVRGKYTYSEGVLKTTGKYYGGILDNSPVNATATVEWLDRGRFVCSGGGLEITYRRKK